MVDYKTFEGAEFRLVAHPKITVDRYYVSADGRVLSTGGKRHTHLMTNCRHQDSYYQVCLMQHESKRTLSLKVHRLVATAWLPNPSNLGYVNHIDENKANNHVSNLEWCTMLHNNHHSKTLEYQSLKGKGINNRAKLVPEDVKDIRMLYSKGFGLSQLGRVYKVAPSCIQSIIKGKTWSWVA